MKKHAALLCSLLAIGCSEGPGAKSNLIGTWKSNSKLSAESVINSQVMTNEQKNYLKNRFGVMQYVFTEKSATYAPVSGNTEDNIYFSWEVLKNGDDKVAIEITGSFSRTEKVEFFRYKNCLGLYNSKYDYSEFFCKPKTNS